ncbi:MAG: dTMP kinase [Chloroflexota bacterium]
MHGKLIVLEATDGSGKATQIARLYEHLCADGYPVRKIEFPNYASESSALAKMYLNGDFGTDPNAVGPYAASTFYAVDRYASFKKDWEASYRSGAVILADRYTTANMVHQAAKLADEAERTKYLDWLWDFEFGILGLPVPDCVVFLDMPPAFSARLVAARVAKSSDVRHDIHEADAHHVAMAYDTARWVARKYGWLHVSCVADGAIRSIEDIHREVYAGVLAVLGRPC